MLALLLARTTHGQSTWINPGAGDWFTGSNWSPFGVPGPATYTIIANGGEAQGLSAGTALTANHLEVGTNNGAGKLSVDGRSISIGSDLDVGEIVGSFASGPITVTSNGVVTINNSPQVLVGADGSGDIDVASMGATNGATAIGSGQLTIQNTSLIDVFENFDVGQTSADIGATATSTGALMMANIGTLDIGLSFDVGKAGGAGRATGAGMVTLGNVNTISVGANFEIGRASGSNSLGNSAQGTVGISDANLQIGFADPLALGSFSVGDASVLGTEVASAIGEVTLERAVVDVARRINIGRLSGGSTNAGSLADGSLSLIESLATTRQLNIGTSLDSTVGTARGKLELVRSLVDAGGTVTLGGEAELVFELAGTTRADGSGGTGQYSALDAGAVVLDGKLTIELASGFVPSTGNQFQVISTTAASGAFDAMVLPPLPAGQSWQVTSNSSGVLLTVVGPGLAGDYNADGKVDAADYVLWRKNPAAFGGNPAGYQTWRANFGAGAGSGTSATAQAVPEPAGLMLLLVLLFAPPRRNR